MKSKVLTLSIVLILSLFLLLDSRSLAQPTKTLYERLGGVNGVAAVVDDFIDRLLTNEVVTKNESVVSALGRITKPGLKYQVTAFVCEATGGPEKYTGRSMKDSHSHLGISEAEWQASVQELKAALGKFQVPEKEQNELISIVATTKPDIVTAPAIAAPTPVPATPGVPQAEVIPPPALPPNEFPFPDAIKPAPEGGALPPAEKPIDDFPFPDAIQPPPEAVPAAPAPEAGGILPGGEPEAKTQVAPPPEPEPEPHLAAPAQAAPTQEDLEQALDEVFEDEEFSDEEFEE